MNDASEHASPMNSPTRLKSFGLSLFGRRRRTAIWRFLGVALTSVTLLVAATIPAAAAELMRVTFVRHGESAGNASGLIDTSTPGPVLTPLGQQQSEAVVGTLGDNNYDAIYGSSMVRTQLTAAPMSQYLRLPIQVLPGLQEIEAGVFEGTPEADAADGYAQFPLAWTFQGNRDLRIPGSINGHEFDARVDGALQTIYDNGDRNPVVFSHGGTIMFWTMMNTQNLTMAQKIELLRNYHLGNTDYVVIEGNPEDGWTLVNWNGQQFAPEPSLAAEVQLQIRTLTRQLAATAQQVVEAFASRDIATIATAINRGIADAVYSVAKFGRAVNAKLIDELDNRVSPPAPADESEVTSDTDATTATVTSVTETAASTGTASSADTAASATDNAKPLSARETDPTAGAAPQPETVETPDENAGQEDSTEDNVVSDGATDLTDGNKVEPGTAHKRDDATDEKGSDTSESDLGSDLESGTKSGTADTGAAADAGDGSDGDDSPQRDAA